MLAPVPNMLAVGEYGPVRSPPYTPTRGGPEDLGEVRSLYRECATWLARGKQTDQLPDRHSSSRRL